MSIRVRFILIPIVTVQKGVVHIIVETIMPTIVYILFILIWAIRNVTIRLFRFLISFYTKRQFDICVVFVEFAGTPTWDIISERTLFSITSKK
jgi:hypothetical protein